MRIAAFALLTAFMAPAASGQTCRGGTGDWQAFDAAPPDTGNLPERVVPGVLATLDGVVAPFAVLHPRPLIGEITTHSRAFRRLAPVVDGLLTYEANGRFYPRRCDPASGQLDALDTLVDKALVTSVQVNSLQLLLDELGLVINGRPVYSLARQVGELRGRPVYVSEWRASGRAVLLARGDRSPLRPVSQRQYLRALEARLAETAVSRGAMEDDAEVFLRQLIEEARDMPPGELREQMLAEYELTLAEHRASRQGSNDAVNAAVGEDAALIRRYLAATPAGRLDSQAVTFRSDLFLGDFPDPTEDGAHPLVQIDDSALYTGDPARAQLLVFFWAWEEDRPATAAWRAEMEASFPLDELARVLGTAN